jgi:ubiquinone/menaquinone biosynthesis C-methylase UbiE
MDGYRPETYGDAFADVYDDWYRDLHDVSAVAERITALSRGGRVLELGIGTGRLAHPLAAIGVPVFGIDASAAMLRRLTTHGSEAPVPIAVRGDMAELPFSSEAFDTVFVAYNTLFNLPDTTSQQRCLHEAARCLDAEGALVIEAFVPRTDDPPADALTVRHVTADSVVLTASRLDRAEQTIEGQHIEVREAGIRLRPWLVHYQDTDQLDALAHAAGFHLERRSGGWNDEPFDDDSETHVSCYRRAVR